jgi:hypothetical protein
LANFGISSAKLTKTSIQHTHKGSVRCEVTVFLCL